MTAASLGAALMDLFVSFKRMAKHLDFTTIRRAHKDYCQNTRSGKHISSTARQIDSGWDFLWHGDATFYFCKAEAGPGLVTLGHNPLGVHYHKIVRQNWVVVVN